jgi:translation elongation factor EF-Tu-like GTPase
MVNNVSFQQIGSSVVQQTSTPQIAKQLQDQITKLSSQLSNLLQDPPLSADNNFLTSVKDTVIALSQTTKQILGD